MKSVHGKMKTKPNYNEFFSSLYFHRKKYLAEAYEERKREEERERERVKVVS